jgi:anaphase-promoting complex subunit 6
MEHIRTFNFSLAEEYLETALGMCDTDPLLLNELGVLSYHMEQ